METYDCFCKKFNNQVFPLYYSHLLEHVKAHTKQSNDNIVCYCGQTLNSKSRFNRHFKSDHKDLDRYFVSKEDKNRVIRKKIKTLKQLIEEEGEQEAEQESQDLDLNEIINQTIEEEKLALEKEFERERQTNVIFDEIFEKIMKFKLKNTLTNVTIREMVLLFGPLIRNARNYSNVDSLCDKLEFTFKTDSAIETKVKSYPNYVKPMEDLIYNYATNATRFQVIPITNSLKVLCNNEKIRNLLFNDRSEYKSSRFLG